MIHPRDIISSVLFYGGLILVLSFLVRIGRTYGWAKVDEDFKEMETRLSRGHYVWIDKRARQIENIRHNDLLMYHTPPWKRVPWSYEFGRVIGLPGDVVEMRYNKLYRAERVKGELTDKKMLTEPYVPPYQRCEGFSEFIVPRNTVFVMFDQRRVRQPLRNLLVPLRSVHGKVIR